MRARTIILAATLAITSAMPALAQPLARGDVTGNLGWFSAEPADQSRYEQWYHSAYGGAILGWYWTDHHKTEVEFGVTTPGELYAVDVIDVGGRPAYATSRHRYSTRRVTAGQQYQFFRNTWVHPHLAAGVDLTWQTRQQRVEAAYLYDSVTRSSRLVQPERTIGPSTELMVRPFAEVGTKVYLSRRAFFRSDLRLTFDKGVDEALLRFGFGVDF